MLDLLKSFSPTSRLPLEELVSLSAFARQLESEFTGLSVEVPEWIADATKAVRREIKSRNADAIANKIRSAEARLETLKTPSERRESLESEIKRLKKQLDV